MSIDQHSVGPILVSAILFVALASIAHFMWREADKGAKQRAANQVVLKKVREKCCEELTTAWKKRGADLDGWDYTVVADGTLDYHPYKLVDGKKVRVPMPKAPPQT
jgi:hypothetical protein